MPRPDRTPGFAVIAVLEMTMIVKTRQSVRDRELFENFVGPLEGQVPLFELASTGIQFH